MSGPDRLSAAPGGSTQAALQVTLHGVELSSPVLPAVRSVDVEVEHGVVAAGCVIRILELQVAAAHEVLQELRGHVGPAQLRRCAVTAIDPDPGVVADQLRDLKRWVVALPRGVT